MNALWQDLRYALRLVIRRPAFSALVIFFCALGIGANSAMFSVVDGLLQRPLPFRDAEQLVILADTYESPGEGRQEYPVSARNYLSWVEQNEVFGQLAGMDAISYNLTGRAEPLRMHAAEVTAELFPLLGVEAVQGRVFTPEEAVPGGPDVVVIGHALWQRVFGGDESVVGSRIELDHVPYTVVGVLPPEMRFPEDVEVWLPMRLDPGNLPTWHSLLVVGRRLEGVSLEQVRANMATIAARLAQEFPRSNEGWGVAVKPLREQLVGDVARDVRLLFGAVLCLLAIACANISSLFLVRLAQRSREMAVRSALGGGGLLLLRQLVAESLVLSFLGGLLGLALGHFGLDPLLAASGVELESYMRPSLDARVIAFTLFITLGTGLLFGLVPGLRIFRSQLYPFLKEGTRGVLGAKSRLMGSLVVLEVGLALVLLCGAGLLIKSFQALQEVDPGFEREQILSVRVTVSFTKHADEPARARLFDRVLEELRGLPGVRSAGLTTTLPLTKPNHSGSFTIEGRDPTGTEDRLMANTRMVSPDYFATLGIPLLQGRDFDSRDHAENLPVAIISREMARRYWGDENPVGRRAKRGRASSSRPWMEIVGVVDDVKDAGLREGLGATWYMPYSQNAWGTVHLVLRASGDPQTLAGSVKEAIWKVDRDQPIYEVATVEEVVSGSLAQPRFQSFLFGFFALLALLLATVGIYGVLSFATSHRTHEIGLRMALGSSRAQVWRLILRHGLSLVSAGLVLGLAGSLLLGRLLASSLFEVAPYDLGVLLGLSVVLLIVALLATFVPAWRATQVDPMTALHWE